jgi:hypothetical protein
MNQTNQVKAFYQTIVEEQGTNAEHIKKLIFQVGTARLVVFIATIGLIYLFWGQTLHIFLSLIAGVISFLALLVYHNKLFRRKDYSETQLQLAVNELKGLEYDYSSFDGGKELVDPSHSFSFDLDLFGKRSIFQSLNRTISAQGKGLLATMLQNPLTDKLAILERQHAVRELADKYKLLIHFRTLALVGSKEDRSVEEQISPDAPAFKGRIFWWWVAGIVPVGYGVLLILWWLNMVDGNIFVPLWFATLFLSMLPYKRVKALMDYFERGRLIPSAYTELIGLIENESFESSLLKEVKNAVSRPELASLSLSKLKKYRSNLDLAFSFPVLLIFNPYLLWNVRYSLLIDKWLNIHKKDLDKWQQAVAQFDALASLATYSFNHPDFTYPSPEDQFVFEGKALGHPLINVSQSVRNDAYVPSKGFFLVVTGANMAGKSTFLRTVGVNYVLACCGTVVCAELLRFHPGHLVTNLRTSDSLNDNESYFFAELKRLKMIIDRLQSGEQLFIILDEILKGTNSEDKRKGSMALMRQLVSLHSNGIIATHDLELGKLETEFPVHVKNYCFEAEIKDEHLFFSYKIREGVAQNMNASFLMKQMGITGI